MPLGDSITFGTPDRSYGGYRHLLGALLADNGYVIDFVGSQRSGNRTIPDPDNEGHPGWTIPQLKNAIDVNGWLETYRPDIILLHIGTNDITLSHKPQKGRCNHQYSLARRARQPRPYFATCPARR